MTPALPFDDGAAFPLVLRQRSCLRAHPRRPRRLAREHRDGLWSAMLRGLDTNFKAIDKNGNGTLDSAEMSAAETQAQQRQIAAIRSRFEAQFAKADTNKDGSLSKAEFMAATAVAPKSTNNGAQMVGQLDKNKDGKVSADEYRTPVLARFDAIDSNKDGTITPAEAKARLRA